MAFESVQVQSTRNGGPAVIGYREDLAAGDVVTASLTSMVGVSTVKWVLKGRPEGSVVGGAGPEPITLAYASSCSFTVDANDGVYHTDGTYVLEAVINPGSPGETRRVVLLARLSGLFVTGPGGTPLPLRKMGGFESTEDTEKANISQGWKTQAIRWLEYFRQNAGGGGGVDTVTAGTGISVTGTVTNPVINNAGVLTISAGTNISITGTAQNPIINSSGGGGGGAANTLFRRTNLTGMVAIDTSVFLTSDCHICEVLTLHDFFVFVPGSSAIVDGITVLADGGALGRWIRLGFPSQIWQTQATWSIDEANVSGVATDEQTGVDDTHPLRTADEFVRRVKGVALAQATTVRWMSDTAHASLNLTPIMHGTQVGSYTANPLLFVGVPTVVRSGTLTGAADAPWTVSDSSLPTSWSASGCLSTSSGSRIIRRTDGLKYAAMGYENVAKTAEISPTNGWPATTAAGTASASFVSGDNYEVLSLPKFPSVILPVSNAGVTTLNCHLVLLDLDKVAGGQAQIRHCGWRASGASVPSGCVVQGCVNVGSFTFSGTTAPNRCLWLSSAFMSAWTGNLQVNTNLIAKTGSCQLLVGCNGRLGTLYVFDCSASAIQVIGGAQASVDGIFGSSNTGFIVNILDPGSKLSSSNPSPSTAFTATTSAASQLLVTGTNYNWSDLPIWQVGKNAGFSSY